MRTLRQSKAISRIGLTGLTEKKSKVARELHVCGGATQTSQKDFWHRNLSVGHILAEDHVGYFRNGESNPGLQGENLLS